MFSPLGDPPLPELKFQVPYESREGHCPDCDDWTFHHVLPVRYFWCTAFIVVKLIRLLKCKDQGVKNVDEKMLEAEFGTEEAINFCQQLNAERKELVNSCKHLHRTPANNKVGTQLGKDSQLDLSNPNDIAAIAHDLTGPKYGGFAGMKPDQRSDDPGSRVERTKPASFPEQQWNLLQELAAVLEQSLQGLKDKSNGPFQCSLNHDRANVILHCLRTLTAEHGRGVPPFNPSDWRIQRYQSWHYMSGIPKAGTDALSRGQTCGKVFYLGDGTQGGVETPANNLGTIPQRATMVTRSLETNCKDQMLFVNRK